MVDGLEKKLYSASEYLHLHTANPYEAIACVIAFVVVSSH